jgi:hypothetical protein
MRTYIRLIGAPLVALGLFVTCLAVLASPPGANANIISSGDGETMPQGGFVADGPAVNAQNQPGRSPALGINPDTGAPWVALAQGGQIVVSAFDMQNSQWAQQGDGLNSAPAGASDPALAFGGATPWAAWVEPVDNVQMVHAAYFDGSAWQRAGETLNHTATENARLPSIATGAFAGGDLLPWAAWSEQDASGHDEVLVSRAVINAGGQGGYAWQPVGAALNFRTQGDATAADLVFSGAGEATPWVVWQENALPQGSQIFASYALSDATTPGGARWQSVGRAAECVITPNTCALNTALVPGAGAPQIASGLLAGETQPVPWVVFSEQALDNTAAIRVMRLDLGGTPDDDSDDRFIPVGGAVNIDCLEAAGFTAQGGSQPNITFVGNVPHVAWVEQQNGLAQLFVCHLADARPGQERWDLDTNYAINRWFSAPAALPSLGSNGETPYVAWQEGTGESNVFVAHRHPDGPAWGRNYPPFIRTISWSRDYFYAASDVTAAIAQTIDEMITNDITFTTSCNHVEGWEQIREIQFKLASEEMTAFLGRYVAAENKVYVENPDQPGVFLPPVTPGVDAPLETRYIILNTPAMAVRSHGPGSAVLDIDWVMSFRPPTMMQDFAQSINIVYDNGSQTGFFQTGVASLDYRTYFPTLRK